MDLLQNHVIELKFDSKNYYKNPFKEINLDVYFTGPDGKKIKVPAFWSGKNTWRVRYSSNTLGKHNYVTQCSNKDDVYLNNKKGVVVVEEYKGNNSLYKHGPLRVNSRGNYLEHVDGTPFLWLADTWWYALIKSWKWPDIFKECVNDRVEKGFNAVQLTAGFSAGIRIFDSFGANEAGYPFNEDLETINPYFFDFADKKMKWLIHKGLLPVIFGSWGSYMDDLGIDNMKKFWKCIIARWGAYPIVWSVAAEARLTEKTIMSMNSDEAEIKKITEELGDKWTEIAKYIRVTDPFDRLLTVHPSPADGSYSSRDVFKDSSLYDIDMLQTGHLGQKSLKITIEKLRNSINNRPKKPVINGEVCYEGIMGSSWQEIQRFLFWSQMLSGAAGHTYGVEGLYNFNVINQPWLGEYGSANWKEGINFLGSYQVGIGKKFLEKFEWFNFEFHHEWVEPNNIGDNIYNAYCAVIPKKIRIIYIPGAFLLEEEDSLFRKIKIKNIEDNTDYAAYFFNPRNGNILEVINMKTDENGDFVLLPEKPGRDISITACPTVEDWVLILENKNESNIIKI